MSVAIAPKFTHGAKAPVPLSGKRSSPVGEREAQRGHFLETQRSAVTELPSFAKRRNFIFLYENILLPEGEYIF